MNHEELWQKISGYLEESMSKESFDLWIKPIVPVSYDDEALTLQVPNKFFSDWLAENQKKNIEKIIEETTGKLCDLRFSYLQNLESILKKAQLESDPVPAEEADTSIASEFNPKYKFETFIEGASNRFAKATCVAAASNPGKEYNPIFIYGGVGLGKTHLLHAIAHRILQNNPKARVLYAPSEQFINEFIDSMRYNTPASFRNKFRTLDCLLLDDVQFLISKERSEEEFFYTFNALYDSRKQIVITADRPPKEMINIDERLISRMEWGVIADIKPPDLETRIAILRKKAEFENVFVPDDVTVFLASQIKSNIRELEGSLIRIVAFSSLTGTPLTVDVAKEILNDIIRREQASKPITIEKIQKVVARHYHIDLKDMKSKRRTDAIAMPRQIAMYISRNLTELSTIEIGESFGGKDHTTVMYACDKIKKRLKTDPFFVAEVNKITQNIKESE
jgi:chromosomal replication initiator protein